MSRETKTLVVLLCLLLALLAGVVSGRLEAQAAACDSPFVVLNAPVGMDAEAFAAVDSYLADVYGADDRPHVLAFYADYRDIQAVLGNMVGAHFADLSGFGLRRVRWDTARCKQGDDGIRARVAMASSRFDGATLYGLAVHELSHLYGTPDGDGTGMDASWWERTGYHAYNGTCGQLSAQAQPYCDALLAAVE